MAHDNQIVANSNAAARRPQEGLQTRTLLVAVDFSETSEATLLWACDYAGRTGAGLEILHVLHDPPDAPGRYKSGNGDPLAPMADVADDLMARFLDRSRRDHPNLAQLTSARPLVREGLPADTIIEVAEECGVDLIVMGGRERHRLQRLLLGSTAARVLERSWIPVTIVKGERHG